MQTKKVPLRMCLSCRNMKPKNELIRIVKNDDGFHIDEKGKINGRGAYICKNQECVDIALKKKVLNKNFGCNVDIEFYNLLKERINAK